jgi:hypothetical protein
MHRRLQRPRLWAQSSLNLPVTHGTFRRAHTVTPLHRRFHGGLDSSRSMNRSLDSVEVKPLRGLGAVVRMLFAKKYERAVL